MDYLAEPQRKIRAALLKGKEMTTAEANREGNTVDARKIISRLRNDEKLPIGDRWHLRKDENGKTVAKYKSYFYRKPEQLSFQEEFWNLQA